MDTTNVYERGGKCLIRWREGATHRQITLDIPYSKAGVNRAWKIREQHIKAYKRGDERQSGKAPTFGELAQTRLQSGKFSPETRRTTKSYLNNYWLPLFSVPVDAIQYADMLDLFSGLDKAPKTIKHILTAGSGVFNLAIKSNWRTDNPANLYSKEIKLAKRKIDPFTIEERDSILDALEPNHHLFYAIRFYCGLRPSELIALTWADYKIVTIKLEDGSKEKRYQLEISKGRVKGNDSDTTKTLVDRTVPVHPFVQNLLAKTPRQLHDKHIVTTQHGKGFRSATRLSDAFVRAMKRQDIRYRNPYNCRHTCAVMMLVAGMKPGYCAKVLGHSLEMFFRIYADWIDPDESERQRYIWANIK
jgi:integrase